MPGNYSEQSIQHSEHSQSLKSYSTGQEIPILHNPKPASKVQRIMPLIPAINLANPIYMCHLNTLRNILKSSSHLCTVTLFSYTYICTLHSLLLCSSLNWSRRKKKTQNNFTISKTIPMELKKREMKISTSFPENISFLWPCNPKD